MRLAERIRRTSLPTRAFLGAGSVLLLAAGCDGEARDMPAVTSSSDASPQAPNAQPNTADTQGKIPTGTKVQPTKKPTSVPNTTATAPSAPSVGTVWNQNWRNVHNPDLAQEIKDEGEVIWGASGNAQILGVPVSEVVDESVLEFGCVVGNGDVRFTRLNKGLLPEVGGNLLVRIAVGNDNPEVCGFVSGGIDDTPVSQNPSYMGESTIDGGQANLADRDTGYIPLLSGVPTGPSA